MLQNVSLTAASPLTSPVFDEVVATGFECVDDVNPAVDFAWLVRWASRIPFLCVFPRDLSLDCPPWASSALSPCSGTYCRSALQDIHENHPVAIAKTQKAATDASTVAIASDAGGLLGR
jgi:hypothetical protein